jgi:hypothetical protein
MLQAMGTAKTVNFFDKLLDSVNGRTLHPCCGKPLFGGVYKTAEQSNIYAIEQNRFLMASGGGYFAQSLLCPTYRRLLKMN